MKNRAGIRDAKLDIVICLLLALGTLAVYWPVVGYDFTDYDDPGYVSANAHVLTGFSWENLAWAFRTGHMGFWQPMTWLSLMLDMQLFGTSAAGPHATNLLLHIVNGILLYLLLRQMTGTRWRSALVAGLFALHPLRVESVAWVCERRDVLCAFFFMLTLWAYVIYVQKSEARSQKPGGSNSQSSTLIPQRFHNSTVQRFNAWYLLSLFFFVLGLMSKPMLVTVPFVLLLLDYWPLQRFKFPRCRVDGSRFLRLVWEKAPFFLLSALFCAITFFAQIKVGAVVPLARLPLAARVPNAFVGYTEYLAKTFWPVGLANPYPNPWQWPVGQVVFAVALVGCLCVVAFWSARKLPFLFTSWFWFLGTLVPVIGLAQSGGQPLADRFTYIPLIGLFLAVVWGCGEVINRYRLLPPVRFAAGALAILVLGACGLRAGDQLRHWRNSETLFRRAIAVTRGNHIACNNLGAVLERQGQLDEAVDCYSEALRFKPDFAEAHNNLGHAMIVRGRLEEAEAHIRQALALDPKSASACYHLGMLLFQQGRMAAARDAYRQAVGLNNELPDAHNNLGCLLAAQGKSEQAIRHFEQALRSRPDFAGALNNLGSMLTERGRAAEAVPLLEKAVGLEPAYTEAHYNLGNACLALNRRSEAFAAYQAALALKPKHLLAHYKAGNLLLAAGDIKAAEEHYRAALAGNPNYAEAHYQLATMLAARKEPAEAITHYRAAVELKPNWIEPLNNLAWLLATHPDTRCRDGAEAVRLASRAVELTRTNDVESLDTLAAAYAESGRFPLAIETVQHAIQLATAPGTQTMEPRLRERLQRYKTGQPYHK